MIKHVIWTPESKHKFDVFTTADESVKINGFDAEGFTTTYFGTQGDSATMSFNIVNEANELQVQLDSTALGYPPVLAMPVLKMAGGGKGGVVVDEVYFSTTLTAGVVSVTGSFPSSGNWKMLTSRINDSLAEIGADWRINKQNVTFRIGS